MEREIWKDIPDYEGFYQISNMGRVRSVSRTRVVKNRYGKMSERTDRGKIMSPADNGNGYQYISLRKNGAKPKHFYIHRLVATAFCDNIECKPAVNHKDYNRKNNRADNLEWVTVQENINYSAHKMRGVRDHAPLGITGHKYIGVHNCKGKQKYRVYIKPIGVCKHFDVLSDAIEYRDEVMRVWRESAFCVAQTE